MTRLPALALLSLALVAGCATTVQKGPADAPASTSAAAAGGVGSALPDQPVKIPASAKRRVVLAMTGPANVVNARDWKDFKEEFRAVFAEHAKAAGIDFAMQDDVPRGGGPDGTVIAIQVNDYRMIGIGSRIMLGIFSGNAYVDARVRFADLRTGATFGEQAYNTTSTAWHGVFAKMTPQQVDAIAAEVFGEIKRP